MGPVGVVREGVEEVLAVLEEGREELLVASALLVLAGEAHEEPRLALETQEPLLEAEVLAIEGEKGDEAVAGCRPEAEAPDEPEDGVGAALGRVQATHGGREERSEGDDDPGCPVGAGEPPDPPLQRAGLRRDPLRSHREGGLAQGESAKDLEPGAHGP